MLVDALKAVPLELVTEGIMLYRFTPDACVPEGEYVLHPNRSIRYPFNLFFCCGGELILRQKQGGEVNIRKEEIVLLSGTSDFDSVVVKKSPVGYCLTIDPPNCTLFSQNNQLFAYSTQRYEAMQAFLQKHGGYLQIKHGIWKQSVFTILASLPDTEQGSYCVLKAAELCYLCHTRQLLYEDMIQQPSMPDYMNELFIRIGTYIENHLDEKLTIPMLCQQFNLSPTTLKNRFREFYGQPIHNWIQYRRICRAADLLQTTNMTVLQIAHSVGYESISQFNAVFRRTYGTTPRLYKKSLIP